MSDDTPNRTIDGLVPRTSVPDLSRLQARNRAEPKNNKRPGSIAANSAQPGDVPVKSSATVAVESTTRMTTYLSNATRDRARATYRATSHLEGDRSWSDFVERAILAEVERRENAHNVGERYEGDSTPLPAGRPLG